jgi:hypothetical protein
MDGPLRRSICRLDVNNFIFWFYGLGLYLYYQNGKHTNNKRKHSCLFEYL